MKTVRDDRYVQRQDGSSVHSMDHGIMPQAVNRKRVDLPTLDRDNPGIITDWITRGGDINAVTEKQWTIGHEAARHGHVRCLNRWIDAGGHIHARDEFHQTIGHRAARNGHAKVLKAWIDAGGDVHACDDHHLTIGHYIGLHGNVRCLKTWIDAGGDVHALGDDDWTIGYCAARNGHWDCLKAWIQSGGNIHAGYGRHGGYHEDDLITDVASTVGKHPCIHITKASISLMTHGSIPRFYRPAFRDPRGIALAERMVSTFTDPMHMGIWIQTIADHRLISPSCP